jgi:hypothetical protein
MLMTKNKATKPYPVSNLKYLHDTDTLLIPEYQREEVWSISQKQLLMDSLFQEIDIPKIYFRVLETDSTHEFEVVDGQQRLASIFEFMSDVYPMGPDADDVAGQTVAGFKFSGLPMGLQMAFQNAALDVVELRGYSDDDIEEIFLRLQNGTPLNAAEKRRAIGGNMRNVVKELADHDVFKLASFNDKRYAFEDAASKALHMLFFGAITDIRPTSIRRTYEHNTNVTIATKEVAKLKGTYNFLVRAFRGKQNPKLKKYSMITLPYLMVELLDTYNVSSHDAALAESLLDFEKARVVNTELPEDQQDPVLTAYTNAARSDSVQDMSYRHGALRDYIAAALPDLQLKDPDRSFTSEQRMAIYRRDEGVCRIKGPNCEVECDDTNFHADHKVPHTEGGKTTVENGQVSCIPCNLWKGGRA